MLTTKICLNKLLMPIALLLTLLFAAASHADTITIEELMQTLANTKSNHVTFTEKKYIALLDEPVESSGELLFTAPNHLEKRTLLPKPEALIVDGNKILIERGSKTYRFTLQNLPPELGAFINSIRDTLAGDLDALKQRFQLHLETDTNQWLLRLTPVDTKMQKLFQHIRIGGFSNQIHSIEILQTDGDSAVMTIKPASKL